MQKESRFRRMVKFKEEEKKREKTKDKRGFGFFLNGFVWQQVRNPCEHTQSKRAASVHFPRLHPTGLMRGAPVAVKTKDHLSSHYKGVYSPLASPLQSAALPCFSLAFKLASRLQSQHDLDRISVRRQYGSCIHHEFNNWLLAVGKGGMQACTYSLISSETSNISQTHARQKQLRAVVPVDTCVPLVRERDGPPMQCGMIYMRY